MVDTADLQQKQGRAMTIANKLGLTVEQLTDAELEVFGRAYERQFITNLEQRLFIDIMIRHQTEALLGAMVAKSQMKSNIGGEVPGSGKVGGPYPIRAGYLGIGDDWEAINEIYGGSQNAWSTGAAQNWIHAGTTKLAGTDGSAIKILENAVHVVFGVGSLHPNPKLESMQFTIDGKERPVHVVWPQMKQPGAIHVHEFDNAMIFKKDNTILCKLFFSAQFGEAVATVTDFPYLIGVSYIKEAQTRILDPASLPGTTQDLVTTS